MRGPSTRRSGRGDRSVRSAPRRGRVDGAGQGRRGAGPAEVAEAAADRTSADRTGTTPTTPPRPAAADRARRLRAERAARRERLVPAERPARSRKVTIRRRVALAVLVLLTLAGLGVGFWAVLVHSGLAEVERVEVAGDLTVPEEDILAAAAVETGVPLATVDTRAVAERVAALPGIASVQVGRGWLHTVEIAVVERTPVALARTPAGITLVDATGVAYKPAPAVPPLLPMFGFGAVGPDDPSTRAALAVLDALPPDLRAQVTTVDVDNVATAPSVRFGLGERQVRFGTPDRAAQKIAVLVPLLTQPGSVYDVASPELPTVTR